MSTDDIPNNEDTNVPPPSEADGVKKEGGNAEENGVAAEHVPSAQDPSAEAEEVKAESQDDDDNESADDSSDSDNPEGSDSDEDEEEEEEEEDPLAHLPDYVIKRVDKLKDLDQQRDRIMQTYLDERAALELKYAALVEPLYKERSQIILGEQDKEIAASLASTNAVKEEETETAMNGEISQPATGDPTGNPVAADSEPQEGQEPHVKGVPQFWVCAMTHNDTIGELISEDDVDCLENLMDVTCEDRKDGKGFTLYFHFAPNDYFKNSVLKKTYQVPNLLLSDEPWLKGVEGTKVEWKSDERALTYKMAKKKQRGKGKNAGQVRTVAKKEDQESFFRWFEPPEMPSMDAIDEEEAERLEELFDDDYEVADAFRSHVIPKAVLWFTGQAEDEQLANAMKGETDDVEEVG